MDLMTLVSKILMCPHYHKPEIHMMIATTQKDMKFMSLGQIHQTTLEAPEKLCILHQHFSEIVVQKSKFTKAGKKSLPGNQV
jgi:hypothetical protein